MANMVAFDGLHDNWPTEWDPHRDNPLWIPHGYNLPAFLAILTYTAAVVEANRLLKDSGFAITIDKPLYTKPSKLKPVQDEEKGYTEDGGVGWLFEEQDPRHNHAPAGVLALPQFRKRDTFALLRIQNAMNNRDSTQKILRNMLGTGDNVRHYDIANELAKYRRAELGGRTRIQALIEFLEDYSTDSSGNKGTKFYQVVTKDEYNNANIVFFSHPLAFNIIKCNLDVVQIDATYKTNKFNMPLVHFVGITSRDTTFDIAYAFVPNETGDTYREVVKMLRDLFEYLEVVPKCFITDHDKALKAALTAIFTDIPQRRCIWHINQNVQTKAVKYWDLNKSEIDQEREEINLLRNEFIRHWHTLVACSTEELFWEQHNVIQNTYAHLPGLLKYLEEEQLPHYAEWAEWSCKYFPDFGQRATSRVEGAHHGLKLALNSWRPGHIYDVLKDIHEMVKVQRSKHDAAIQGDETRTAIDTSAGEFARLQRRVTHQGLRKLKKQLDMAKMEEYNTSEKCSMAFTSKYRLPCKHTLHRQLAKASIAGRKLVIDPKDLHQHWYFRSARAGGVEVLDERIILDPLKVKPKGRPFGSTTVTLATSQPTRASQAIYGRKPAQKRREKTRNEHVQATQQSQQVKETPDDDTERRRGSRRRQPTQKAREIMEETIKISSAEESSSEDDSESEIIVQEVAVTRTTKKITKKVTKKAAKKQEPLKAIQAAIEALRNQVEELQKAKEAFEGFIDIDTIDITEKLPPRPLRRKRKGPQLDKPSLLVSKKAKKQKK
ncbi:MULE transposase domain protein [Pyrenophora teres f. maculata]|nr:MULE transposase domain protein [Pyrenophora teres f. maculata]